ncbi:MAG TPA: HAD-IA family hydrolase [Polyangiaceae bacterium]|nr:HAD-IA family hydrolase [Polyangiaceae bacterium]
MKLVCFDLGGVLVRICRSFGEACRAAGLDVRASIEGRVAQRIRYEFSQRFNTGKLDELSWANELSGALDGLYTADELRRVHRAWTLGEYEGAHELVHELDSIGVATACLSNTDQSHWTRLVHHDGTSALPGEPEYPSVLRLHHRHASHLFGFAKPNAEIYRAFEAATALRGPEILFFDDLPENVRGARDIGWRAERIDPYNETVPQLRRWLRHHGVLPRTAQELARSAR